jgi:hypothetical protein
MPHYRLYLLKDNTHIAKAIDLDCENNDRLDAIVAEHADGRAMEVWQGAACVTKYPPRAVAKSQTSSGRP